MIRGLIVFSCALFGENKGVDGEKGKGWGAWNDGRKWRSHVGIENAFEFPEVDQSIIVGVEVRVDRSNLLVCPKKINWEFSVHFVPRRPFLPRPNPFHL